MASHVREAQWLTVGMGGRDQDVTEWTTYTVSVKKSLGLDRGKIKQISERKQRDSPGGPLASLSKAGNVGSIPGWGTKIPYALRPKNQNIKRKQYCNKVNKDLKNGPH